MKPEVWYEVVRPMLADRKGWATFIGTPKGKNEFWKIYNDAKKDPAWFHMILRASESRIIAPSELTDPRGEMGRISTSRSSSARSRRRSRARFYAEEMRSMLAEGRICPIEINNDVKTHTAWDLGVSDSTAIWFIQCINRERRLVDYYKSSGVGLCASAARHGRASPKQRRKGSTRVESPLLGRRLKMRSASSRRAKRSLTSRVSWESGAEACTAHLKARECSLRHAVARASTRASRPHRRNLGKSVHRNCREPAGITGASLH
jgi:hypothetical protein